MKKKINLNSLININTPVTDSHLGLSHDEIMSLLDNPYFTEQYHIYFDKYMDYLGSISGIYNIGSYYRFMNIDINEKACNTIITFSPSGLIMSLANMLNCLKSAGETVSFQEIDDAIKNLSRVKDENELAAKYPFLYQNVYLYEKQNGIKNKSLIEDYETAKKDFLTFNIRYDNYKKIGVDWEKEYQLAKRSNDFRTFINTITSHFPALLNNFDEIKTWIRNNPIQIKLKQKDIKKIYLYIIYREIENMLRYADANLKQEAQKNVIIIENLIKKYENMFPNDSTQIKFKRFLNLDKNLEVNEKPEILETDFKQLVYLFEKYCNKFSFLKRDIELPKLKNGMTYDETQNFVDKYIQSIMDDAIQQDIADGSEKIEDVFVDEQVRILENDIKTGHLSEKEINKKRLILKKIKMVLVDIKPLAKQTGIGVFSSYYTYFYPNGMVAIDKLNGYGALYVMPIHIYKEARYKKNLSEVRLIPGVKYVDHRGNNWLEDAKSYILNGTSNLSKSDIDDAENVASMNFPYTIEEMENLQKSLENAGQFSNEIKEETEKIKKRIKLLNDIDNELSSNDENATDLSKDELDLEVDKLNEEEIATFDDLYTFWKQKHKNEKYKRNPAVAEYTKNRARDENGNYCCELCGAQDFFHSSFDSHHMIPLGEGGIDNIYNTVCLCPKCHRHAHSGRMTLYQRDYLFEKIRKHIEIENPEYITKFDNMIPTIAESEEYYNEHKDEIDRNFSMVWNGTSLKTR